ncbi:MAB_1171c family putative transporter [Nucisporomicrobium flavum]|uniref:MAB_1171c family putative transporter n=1 Tax=Nucisporomicrobium flavum TaxID=2785915 RepID=UPI0018F4272C|nr:MAB_1171c family putative transporter [Nucisporomicrobium flavum]
MNGALTGVVLVLLWGSVLVRLPTLWRDAQQRAMWAMLLTLAVTKTVATPGVNGFLADFVSQPQVIPHFLGIAVAFFLLRFISLLTAYYPAHPRAARHQALLAGGVVASLLILCIVTPGGITTKGTELLSTAIAPAAAAYWVVLNGYLGAVLVIASRLFWRVRRSAPPGLLRQGLHAITIGLLMIALYAILKTALVILHACGLTMTVDTIEPIANAVRAIGTILAVIGAAVPAGGKLRSLVRAYRSLRALTPLWRTMRRTFPEVILFSRRRALVELAGVEDVQLRLYRRVIEIRDGLLALRDYLPSDTFKEARAFLGDRATPALVEACGIALALNRHHAATAADEAGAPVTTTRAGRTGAAPAAGAVGTAGAISQSSPGAPPTDTADPRWTDVGGELADEIAWLSAVSAAHLRDEPRAFARLHSTAGVS